MQFAKRVEQLPPYLFKGISEKIRQKRAEGVDIISFAIGDPDLPTPKHIIEALHEAAEVPVNHRYPESDGLPETRQAIAKWYEDRFGFTLNPDTEVLPLIGSKEGIGHVALCFIDPGDVALVPDPAYPVYAVGTMFAGGEVYPMPLTVENDFLPDLGAIPQAVLDRTKVLWINYPSNPTGAVADISFYDEVVHFAKRHDIAVLHDAPYTDIAYDGYVPSSFLQAKGAKDVGIEFHSFSKSYNMTGWRIGMAVGNERMINALMRVKSNLDSGIPQAIQQMAIAAALGDQACVADNVATYRARRDRIVPALRDLGMRIDPPKAGLYLWPRIPEGRSSTEYATWLLEETGVVVTPGVGYGLQGEGFVRISLTTADDRIDEALRRLRALHDKTKASSA